MNLLLADEHYSVDKRNKEKNELLSGVTFKKKTLVVFEIKDDNVTCYDGSNESIMEHEDFYKLKNLSYSGDYAYVNKENKNMSIQEFYSYLMDEAEVLKNETLGGIDLSKSNFSYKAQALKLSSKCLDNIYSQAITNTEIK